jgi:hypothetical protein
VRQSLRYHATLALLTLCMLAHACAQAQLKVSASRSYRPYEPIVLKAEQVSSPKAQFLWDVSAPAKVVEVGGECHVWAPPGSYTARLTAIDFEAKKVERAVAEFSVEGAAPPNPPGPGGPVKVLIIEEAKDRTKLPQAQQLILDGLPMRSYLNKVCATDLGMGYEKAWTIQDKDTDLSALGAFWEGARNRPRAALPWIVIADQAGTVLYEGALPADVPAAQALVGKYTARTRLRKAG